MQLIKQSNLVVISQIYFNSLPRIFVLEYQHLQHQQCFLQVCKVLVCYDIICFDKTGTLTYNNLQVSNFHITNEERFHNLHSLILFLECYQFNKNTFTLTKAVLSTNSAFLQEDLINQIKQNEGKLNKKSQKSKSPSSKSIKSNSVLDGTIKRDWSGNRLDFALIDYIEMKLKRKFIYEYQQNQRIKQEKLSQLIIMDFIQKFQKQQAIFNVVLILGFILLIYELINIIFKN